MPEPTTSPAGPLRPMTLKERQSLTVAGVRVVVLRVNGDGSVLLGVASSAPVAIDRERLPPRASERRRPGLRRRPPR